MTWKLWLAQLALAIIPTLLRVVSKLAAAMAQAIEQLKQAAAASTGAGTGGQAPSGSTQEHEFKQGEERVCLDCMRDKDYCPDCCDGGKYLSPDAGDK